MKKLVLLPVVALGLLFSAQGYAQDAPQTAVETVVQDDMVAVPVENLPEAITNAVAKDHPGTTISEAHATKDATKFKLVLAKEDGETETVLCDAEGNWITE